MIDPKRFYIIGIICFAVIGAANFMNFLISFPNINIFSKIAAAFGIFFNFVIAGFFYYLLKTSLPGIDNYQASSQEDIFKELKESGIQKNSQEIKKKVPK